jgi:hypothetical protein
VGGRWRGTSSPCRCGPGTPLLAFTHYRHGHLHENREPEIQEGLDALLETRRRAARATDGQQEGWSISRGEEKWSLTCGVICGPKWMLFKPRRRATKLHLRFAHSCVGPMISARGSRPAPKSPILGQHGTVGQPSKSDVFGIVRSWPSRVGRPSPTLLHTAPAETFAGSEMHYLRLIGCGHVGGAFRSMISHSRSTCRCSVRV